MGQRPFLGVIYCILPIGVRKKTRIKLVLGIVLLGFLGTFELFGCIYNVRDVGLLILCQFHTSYTALSRMLNYALTITDVDMRKQVVSSLEKYQANRKNYNIYQKNKDV